MCNHPDLLRLKGGKADTGADAEELDGLFPTDYTAGAAEHSGATHSHCCTCLLCLQGMVASILARCCKSVELSLPLFFFKSGSCKLSNCCKSTDVILMVLFVR